eukprot:6481601-Amphidinium_carterae.1
MEKVAVENLKSALADVIKNPPNGLKEFIDQVDVSEAEGLSALVMASAPTPQEMVPTNLPIFRVVEAPPLRVAAPATP